MTCVEAKRLMEIDFWKVSLTERTTVLHHLHQCKSCDDWLREGTSLEELEKSEAGRQLLKMADKVIKEDFEKRKYDSELPKLEI